MPPSSPSPIAEFLIACLCAEWCGTCRDYRPAFEALRRRFPQADFVWVDVEDEPEVAGDVDVDNFPTVVIQRGPRVLFCGPMLPQIGLLERLFESFLDMDEAAAARYIQASQERLAWQEVADIRARLPRG